MSAAEESEDTGMVFVPRRSGPESSLPVHGVERAERICHEYGSGDVDRRRCRDGGRDALRPASSERHLVFGPEDRCVGGYGTYGGGFAIAGPTEVLVDEKDLDAARELLPQE